MAAPTSPHPTPRVCVLRGCEVWIWDQARYLETRFSDGTTVPAAPEPTESYRQTARRCGYGEDVWGLTLAHEISHTLLATWRGLPASPVLWAQAHEERLPVGETPKEEATVLAFQAWVNGNLDALDLLEQRGFTIWELEQLRAELWRHARPF